MNVNPISILADASRGLMEGGAQGSDIAISLAVAAALTLIFAPLTTRLYRTQALALQLHRLARGLVLPSAASTVTFSVAVTFRRGLANFSVSFALPALSSVLRPVASFLPLAVSVADTLQAPRTGP